MKSYKENEESREKFTAEQRSELTKGAKKAVVPEPSDAAGGASEGWGSMFDGPADLAVQRRKDAASSVAAPVAAPVDISGAVPTNSMSA